MIKVNDSTSHPLRFVTDNRIVYGQFYNSIDKKYHLAQCVPFEKRPTKYLCGDTGNFSASRSEDVINKCENCFDKIKGLV